MKYDSEKLRKLNELRELNIEPYPYRFDKSHTSTQIQQQCMDVTHEDPKDHFVSVAGRIMLKRVMGKAAFYTIRDEEGDIQLYINKDFEGFKIFTKKYDVGDIIGARGKIFRTQRGELTVHVEHAEMLCKSLQMLPEKYHGVQDIELKYRQRYLDLIMSKESRNVFKQRTVIVQTIRDYFNEKGFMEVEVPYLQTIYGGANAQPFVTHINAWKMDMYLSISPELFLKRLLVGGFEKVYSIGRCFRNEDCDTTHNPEFTSIEVYEAYTDYEQMMVHLEQCYERASIALYGEPKMVYPTNNGDVTINFTAPWPRLSMLDAIKKYANINADVNIEELTAICKKHNLEWEGDLTWGTAIILLFEELVEPHLIQPVHIIDHPKESTPLCKKHRTDDRLVERFESYCLGMEISNAYSELNDPILQRELLEEQASQLRAGADEAHPMDEDFVTAIEYGMPPAGGLGFGIDRMVIILTKQKSIRDIIFFPTTKPINTEKQSE